MGEVFLLLAFVAVVVAFVVRRLGRRRGTRTYEEGQTGHHFRVVEPFEAVRGVVEYVVQRGEGWLMLEGVFGQVNTGGLPIKNEPPAMLRKHTLWSFPKEQVLVVPLSSETISGVFESMLPSTVLEAEHIQVADEIRLIFGAYDHYEVAWAPEGGLPTDVLRLLEGRGAIARLEDVEDNW